MVRYSEIPLPPQNLMRSGARWRVSEFQSRGEVPKGSKRTYKSPGDQSRLALNWEAQLALRPSINQKSLQCSERLRWKSVSEPPKKNRPWYLRWSIGMETLMHHWKKYQRIKNDLTISNEFGVRVFRTTRLSHPSPPAVCIQETRRILARPVRF